MVKIVDSTNLLDFVNKGKKYDVSEQKKVDKIETKSKQPVNISYPAVNERYN